MMTDYEVEEHRENLRRNRCRARVLTWAWMVMACVGWGFAAAYPWEPLGESWFSVVAGVCFGGCLGGLVHSARLQGEAELLLELGEDT